MDRRDFVKTAGLAGVAAVSLALGSGRDAARPQTASAKKSSSKGQKKHVKAKAPTVKLNSGHRMPVLGIGTWTLSSAVAERSVYTAISKGYRLIDTAQAYGNEAGVGRAVKRAIADGLVKRSELFVTSKILPDDYGHAARAVDASLKRMGLDYLDLMLLHHPDDDDERAYHALEEACRAGKLRSIGISNYYTRAELDHVLEFAQIPPAVIQNENHLRYQNAELRAYAKKACGARVESWYPLGGREHVDQMLANRQLKRIAKAHGVTPAQALLRWQVQAGYVAIPGSQNAKHIAQDIKLFSFKLSAKEMKRLAKLDKHRRYGEW